MTETNGFYEFTQDLVIDLQNKPHKFIDLDSLINQLTSIKEVHGNCRVAIATDRNLKFTYLYRVNKEGQIETDCLYPHKNETLGCTVHHVFIAEDAECSYDHELERYQYNSGIRSNRSVFNYVSIECIDDSGNRNYEITIADNELIILSHNPINRDTNMKIVETFVLNGGIQSVLSNKESAIIDETQTNPIHANDNDESGRSRSSMLIAAHAHC